MKASEKPSFTVELDAAWTKAVQTKVSATELSDDEKKLVQPLFSNEPKFVACRKKVYEQLGKGRGTSNDIVGAVADAALETLKIVRTDKLMISRSTKLYKIFRDATNEVLLKPSENTDDTSGFDLSKV